MNIRWSCSYMADRRENHWQPHTRGLAWGGPMLTGRDDPCRRLGLSSGGICRLKFLYRKLTFGRRLQSAYGSRIAALVCVYIICMATLNVRFLGVASRMKGHVWVFWNKCSLYRCGCRMNINFQVSQLHDEPPLRQWSSRCQYFRSDSQKPANQMAAAEIGPESGHVDIYIYRTRAYALSTSWPPIVMDHTAFYHKSHK